MGVVGFSSIFLVEGVLALEDVPLLGLWTNRSFDIEDLKETDTFMVRQ
jgi:hypothetical protein